MAAAVAPLNVVFVDHGEVRREHVIARCGPRHPLVALFPRMFKSNPWTSELCFAAKSR
jgi:hypothetical protein